MLRKRSRYILEAADYFNKWCEAYPVTTLDAPKIAVFGENGIFHNQVP